MAKRPKFQPAPDQPQDGQVIVFSAPPPGSYCSADTRYRVEAPNHPRGDYRFVNEERGSSTYDHQWAVRMATWSVAA
jgi:hypothetical protein